MRSNIVGTVIIMSLLIWIPASCTVSYIVSSTPRQYWLGVVGWCKGVVYLTSPGHSTDISLQLARPAILIAGKGRVGNVLFFTFILVPLSSLSLSFISSTVSSVSFLPFSGRRCPTGDQEVAGSTPAEVGNILSWRLIMKYFLRSFSPFR